MNKCMKCKLARIALGSIALWVATTVSAVPVAPDVWYEFAFFGRPGVLAFRGMGTDPVPGITQVGSPLWTFTGPAIISLTDNFSQGDSFSLFDNDVLVGTTPAVPQGVRGTQGINPEVALVDPSYSHGVFTLGPGDHALSIRVDNNPFWAGAGFFKLTRSSVPDGGSHLFLIGLCGLALYRWFVSSKSAQA